MAEYLCDPQSFVELDKLPSGLSDYSQAFKNLVRLLNKMSKLCTAKHDELCAKPDILPTYQDATFSWRDFPDNLSEALDRLTVLEFLNKPSEELYPVLDDLEIELSVIVENFDIDAIIDATKRIENLLHLWKLV